jgi:hypothetical protein
LPRESSSKVGDVELAVIVAGGLSLPVVWAIGFEIIL